MGRKMILDDIYYAEQAHEEAPWLIHNGDGRIVGHYSVGLGVDWGALMANADKMWLADLMEQKLGEAPRAPRKGALIDVGADQSAHS